MRTTLILFLLVAESVQACAAKEPILRVGVAKVDVTPTTAVVLAGYGGRTREYEGIDDKLWARALVIGDRNPVAVVALDNCGVTGALVERLAQRLVKHGILQERLVVAVTHTHSAPALTNYAPIVWAGRTTPEQDRRTQAYTDFVVAQMEKAIIEALAGRQPLSLEWAQGRVTFGGNRRVLQHNRWTGFGFQRDRSVDHSLPVMAARDAQGVVRAVWANYACHCTTVGARNFVGGDWAGYANGAMEGAFPSAVSLMTIGCGADIGPQPSGSQEIARQHGESIAAEVRRLLASKTAALNGPLTVTSRSIKLPLEEPRPREHWEAELRKTGFDRQLASLMLKRLDQNGSLPNAVDYPITVWQFGDDLAMVFLAGEVVVDYSVRLKQQLDWQRLWITAWANGVPSYIPSRRVLAEGGYEADFSQVYYGLPERYEVQVEDILINAVQEMVGRSYVAASDQPPSPHHQLPSGEQLALQRLAEWAAAGLTGEAADVAERVRASLPLAKPAIAPMADIVGEQTEWHDFAGNIVPRVFIRQTTRDAQLEWITPAVADRRGAPWVLCFSGGVGWETDPKTDGFGLQINGRERLRFDVTRTPSRWSSTDESIELVYLPTWTSNVDSAGFFFVILSKPDELQLTGDRRISIAVESLGNGSRRWFAIDAKQEIPELQNKLMDALGQTK